MHYPESSLLFHSVNLSSRPAARVRASLWSVRVRVPACQDRKSSNHTQRRTVSHFLFVRMLIGLVYCLNGDCLHRHFIGGGIWSIWGQYQLCFCLVSILYISDFKSWFNNVWMIVLENKKKIRRKNSTFLVLNSWEFAILYFTYSFCVWYHSLIH